MLGFKENKVNLSNLLKLKSSELEDNKVLPNDPDALGIILYCDGGARPNPGFAGYGIHGYIYKEKVDKKGSGHPTHIPTKIGYVLKNQSKVSEDENQKEVQVISYIDAVGSIGNNTSNNVAELEACAKALDIAKNFVVKEVLIHSDSKYLFDGINTWIHKWIELGWIKSDGGEYINKELWLKILESKTFLEQKGIKVDIQWMYGHSGDAGNEKADSFATIGVMKAMECGSHHEVNYIKAEGYWKNDVNRHPLLSAKSLYYLNEEEHNKPGLYYVGSHGKDDEALGTRMTDGCFAIIELDDVDETIEMIRNRTIELGKKYLSKESVFMLSNLDAIHRPETQRIINQFGKYALVPVTSNQLGLTSVVSKEVLAYPLTPSRVAFRSLGALEEIDTIFRNYLSNENQDISIAMPGFAMTDLTDLLFEIVVKKKGKKEESFLQLKKEYDVGFTQIKTNVNYYDQNTLKQCELTIILGVDLPNRNALKRMELLNPKIQLLTWMDPESSLVFRYLTIITMTGAKSIWSGHYSNYRYLGETIINSKVN